MSIFKTIIGALVVCFTAVPFSWVLTHISASMFKKGKLFSSPCLLISTLIAIELISGGVFGLFIFKILKLEPHFIGMMIGMCSVTLYSSIVHQSLMEKFEREKKGGKSNP